MADQTFVEMVVKETVAHYSKPAELRKQERKNRKKQQTQPLSEKYFGALAVLIKSKESR
ncbi:YqzE-like protein [Amphibacillus marinus]|uniref:YqzE-like protein n=1 Tax=Amphibacillus marinus TaxID=872970 RepID=A0A1H8HF92_9BACI|nr:YqzE family protein [Amphibacillus marinus]SEN54238.1 YqzE-like protein [Amphibacillus marinus]